jgi:hypothetical protein
MSARLEFISTVLAASSMALAYGLAGLWIGVGLLAALGLLCLVGQWRSWGWVLSAGLVLFVTAATLGLWLSLPTGWMLAGVVAALSAWDLNRFARRLKRAGHVESARELEQSHLWRLLAVDALGAAVAAATLGLRIELGFGAAFLLGLIAVLALSRAIGWLRRESD